MGLNTAGPLNQLKTLVESITGIQDVYIGVPENLPKRASAYIALGSQPILLKATGVAQRDARYQVTFGYRVGGAEAAAELTIAGWLDAFLQELLDDLTLAGTCEGLDFDTSLADAPGYEKFAGLENRLYPVVVACRQRTNYSTSG